VSSAAWSDTQVRSGTSYCRRIYNALPLGFASMHASSLGKAGLVFAVAVALVHEGRVDLTGSMDGWMPWVSCWRYAGTVRYGYEGFRSIIAVPGKSAGLPVSSYGAPHGEGGWVS